MEYEQLDADIQALEDQNAALLIEMNGANPDHRKIAEQGALLKAIEQELEQKTERWLELSEWVD